MTDKILYAPLAQMGEYIIKPFPAPGTVDKIANVISDYYDEDAEGRWRKCAEHVASMLSSSEGRVPDREVFWLVERIGHGQYVQDRSERPSLTPDPWRAARFATEVEAHDFWLRLISLRDECKPVEHLFVNKPGLPAESEPAKEPAK
jgi:hypothetical protein